VNAYYHVYDYDIQTTLYRTVRRTERRKVCVNLTGIIVWFSFDIMMSCSLPVPFLVIYSVIDRQLLHSVTVGWSHGQTVFTPRWTLSQFVDEIGRYIGGHVSSGYELQCTCPLNALSTNSESLHKVTPQLV